MILRGLVLPRRQGLGRLSALEPLVWLAAALAAAAAVLFFQVRERAAFLVWDEAVRVSEGAVFSDALRAGDLAGAWGWMHWQIVYPALAALPHGIVLLFTSNLLVAASAPSIAAYACAGLLTGRLVRSLGGDVVGAWLAAVLYWSTPVVARLAGGAFTESTGACLFLLLLLGLIHVHSAVDWRPAALTGAVVATAWLVKYDYGILTTGVLGVHAIASLASRRSRGSGLWRRYRIALYCAAAPVLVWFCINSRWKVAGALGYIFQELRPPLPGESVGPDFTYYARTLFGGPNGELGISRPLSMLLLGGLIWAVLSCKRRPWLRSALVLLSLWYVMYSLPTNPKFPRYLAPLLPVLTSLCGVAVSQCRAKLQSLRVAQVARGAVSYTCSALLSAALVWQVAVQVSGPTGWRNQYPFLKPYTPVVEASAFVSGALGSDGLPVLMLGQTNEFSPAAVRLAWEQRLGRAVSRAYFLPEVPPQDRVANFVGELRTGSAGHVVAVDLAPGSRLDSDDFRIHFPSQRDYPRIAEELAQRGILRAAGAASFDGGAQRVAVYDVVPGMLPEALTVAASAPAQEGGSRT